MEHAVIYEFAELSSAKSAIQHIEQRYGESQVTGLNFVSDGKRHIVAACTDEEPVAEELQRLCGEHDGTPSSLDLDGVIALPSAIKLLGSAVSLIDYLGE